MAFKAIRNLAAGDRVALADSSGTASITSVKRTPWIRTTSGPAYDVQWEIISGHRKHEKGQYIGGAEEEIEILA